MWKSILLVSVLAFSEAVQIPSNFHKCNRNQPDVKKCILEAAQHGVSQMTKSYENLNLPGLEPLQIAEISLNGGSGPVSVTQKFKNCKIYGLTKIHYEKFEFNFEKKNIEAKQNIPEVVLKCDYQVIGKVLLLPVNGEGNATVIIKNLKASSLVEYNEIKKKDKTYIHFESCDVSLDPELIIFDFLNFKDRRLSDNINPVLNENWKAIFEDVRGGYENLISQIIINLGNAFFSKISLEEAFD